MFEAGRLEKPFLTVETGEAYQPIRLTYDLYSLDKLVAIFNSLGCLQKNPNGNAWNWYWKEECDDQHFESIDSFRRNPAHPVRLGTLTIRNNKVYLNLPSFKRACLAVPFFHRLVGQDIMQVHLADFVNKVFGLDERLPHGFAELFKEEELDRIMKDRAHHYELMQEQCSHADTSEAAFKILSEYTKSEAEKRLPYAERYVFEFKNTEDSDIIFLAFYIYLRGRELVAIRRWFGQTGYTLADAADEAVQQVFGDVGIDILE